MESFSLSQQNLFYPEFCYPEATHDIFEAQENIG